MLQRTMRYCDAEYLATYTRNPAVLGMLQRVGALTYPLSQDEELETLASQMPYATQLDNVVCHVNRYGESGLFQGDDPANNTYDGTGESFKTRFSGLESVRNALIVTSRIERKK